jgi:hypothetical protein
MRSLTVRFGSKADIGEGAIDVRFTPKTGHRLSAAAMSALLALTTTLHGELATA